MKSSGVSEVVGTIILVGIVMLGIALVGILLLSNPTPSNVPVFDFIISNQSRTVYIYHKGGDALYRGQYSILVDGGDQTSNFTIMSPGTEPFTVGETLSNTTPNMPGHVVIVFNTGRGGGTVIGEADFISIVSLAQNPNAWYFNPIAGSCNWKYRKKITIDHTRVSAALTNFPVLVSLSGLDPTKIMSNGNDIVFTSSDGMTQIPHEIESYASGSLIAWVNVPTLSSSTDTVLYMYYGNASSTPQQNPTGVWDSNFVMVQHMNGGSWTAINDSTVNKNNVTYQNRTPSYLQPGKIGTAVSFGGNSALEIKNSASLSVTSQVTICAWINPTAITAYNRIGAKSYTSNALPYTEYGLMFDASAQHLRGEIASSGTQNACNGTTVVPTGTWTYSCMNYDHSAIRVYMNGSLDNQTALSGNIDTDAANFSIGRSGYGTDYFTGTIDEVRVSNIARSAPWIATEFANENNPSSFYSVGSEEKWWKC